MPGAPSDPGERGEHEMSQLVPATGLGCFLAGQGEKSIAQRRARTLVREVDSDGF